MQNVDVANSHSAFNIPIADSIISPGLRVSVSISHTSGDATNNGLLGNSWTLHSTQDYIVVDHKQSMFPENHQFQLFVNGNIMELKPNKDKPEEYTIDDMEEIKVTYNKEEERWVVDTPYDRSVYGKPFPDSPNFAAYQWSLRWPNWRGPGRNEDAMEQEIIGWYLVSKEERLGAKRKLYYNYFTEYRSTPQTGKNFTSELLLESINDSENRVTLELKYTEKTKMEVVEKAITNADGHITFPIPLTQKHCLSELLLTTDYHQQHLEFLYSTEDKDRYLTEINQIFHHTSSSTRETLLEFDYERFDSNRKLLKQISIPEYVSSVKFDYSKLEIPLLQFQKETLNVIKYPATTNTKIQQSDDYAVMAYDLGTGGIFVRVLNRQLTRFYKDLYTCSETSECLPPNLFLRGKKDTKEIKSFAPILYPNLIALVEERKDDKSVHIFSKCPGTTNWTTSPVKSISFPKEAIFRYSDEIMAIACNKNTEKGKISIIEPTSERENCNQNDVGFKITDFFISTRDEITRMFIQGSRILAYSGNTYLYGLRKNATEQWQQYSIDTQVSQEKIFFGKFTLNETYVENFLQKIPVSGLHMVDNMVLLSALRWDDPVISTHAHVYLLNDNFQVMRHHNQRLKSENVVDIEYKHKLDDGTVMVMKYKSNEEKYEGYLHDITGPMFDETCKESEDKEKCKKDLIERMQDANGDDFKMFMLFDSEPFMDFTLDQYSAKCFNGILNMAGNSWMWAGLSPVSNIRLGAGFILKTTEDKDKSETSYALYRQDPITGSAKNISLASTVLGTNGTMAIGYPSYWAYQPDPRNQPELYTFTDESQDAPVIRLGDRGEQILQLSNHEIIATIRDANDPSLEPFDKLLLIRRVNSVVPSATMWSVSKTEVQFGGETRIKSYENSFLCNEYTISQENSIRTIPTGNISYSGYYEERSIIPVENPSNTTKYQNWYNSNGTLVFSKNAEQTVKAQLESEQSGQQVEKEYKIWDASGEREIADIAPYNITDNMIAYFGFEPYESNQFKFSYPTRGVLNDEFSLTGEQLLRLNQNNRLSTSITPVYQQSSFIASAWVRAPSGELPYQYDSPVSYFMAHLKTHNGIEVVGIHGQMKRQKDKWTYLELPIDLNAIRNHLYSEIYRYAPNQAEYPVPSKTNFTITLEISISDPLVLDVDHIRFTPTQFDLSVKVFSSRSGSKTEQILSNGEIIRSIYDSYGMETATIDEEGNVEEVKCISFTGSTFPKPMPSEPPSIQYVRKEVLVYPEHGKFEYFDKYSCQQRWDIEQADTAWAVTKGKLFHLSNSTHRVSALSPEYMFDPKSSAIKFFISRLSDDASISLSFDGYNKLIEISGRNMLTIGRDCRQISNIPTAGEILVHIEDQTIWLWFDGVLLADRVISRGCLPTGSTPSDKPWSRFELTVTGPMEISNIITMARPQVTVQYQNAWGDPTQMVKLENSNSVLVSEVIYDEAGRDAIKVKSTRIIRAADHYNILKFHDEFVTNRDVNGAYSVFKTGFAEGLANDLNPDDEGYPFTRNIYHDDPLREKQISAMPGKQFSVQGSFRKQYARQSGITFLKILFPPENGFREKVVYNPNGSMKVTVLDTKDNEIAEYVKVEGFNNIFSINEYDENGNLLKILPPEYHERMNTFTNRTTPWEFGDDQLSAEERHWQQTLGTHFQYDNYNQVILKKTPDLGTKGFIRDPMGNIRFMYTLLSSNTSETNDLASDIVYMLHSGINQPVEIGYMKGEVPVHVLKSFENSTSVLSNSYVHQRVVYSDSHSNPNLRGKLRLFQTFDDPEEDPTMRAQLPHQEILQFNTANQVIMKTSNSMYSGPLTNYKKHYQGLNIGELQYPAGVTEWGRKNDTGLSMLYKHDKMGNVLEVGTRTSPADFVKFSYNPAGQLVKETIEPNSENPIYRTYEYDSPGQLVKIEDRSIISQSNSFIAGGYGQTGYGDGVITQTIYNSSWSMAVNLDSAQRQWFRLPVENYQDDSVIKICLKALQRVGLVDKETLIPLKFLTHEMLSALPIPCSGSAGHTLMNLIARFFPMSAHYGYKYAYGSQQELVKAKFFADPENAGQPLQVNSLLTEISEVLDILTATDIWNRLASGNYILIDNHKPDDVMAAIGKQGSAPIFKTLQLQKDLVAGVDVNAGYFAEPIMKLLTSRIFDEKTQSVISLEDFQITYIHWHGYIDMEAPEIIINRAKEVAKKIYQVLLSNEYLVTDLSALLEHAYLNMLKPYAGIVPKITKVLISHFATQIGKNVFDYENYRIDANGNQKVFYMGLNRYELEYEENTNKVKKLRIKDPYQLPGEDEQTFEIQHDSQGNMSNAPHHGVRKIKYHPVINRPTFMELDDGQRITIKYDAQGERVLKRVFSSELKLLSQVKYLRDEEGTVLMDQRITYDASGAKLKDQTTTYLYGPRKTILGFIRDKKFYAVFTDHAGSVRLITHKGRVVAGYEYFPYGESCKTFGDNDAHIMYRFTGQEYDPETGMYNYHARLYDPTIGRFLQPDPKLQYFSPYVYGGNSPVSFVDPDGEFFIMLFIAIACAVAFAYFGAASVNGSFNPAKWNWKSGETWLALIGGAVAGFALPGAFMALAGSIFLIPTILVGLAGAYLKGAAHNKSWNPADWNWKDPGTYNAFLEGFSTAINIGNGIASNVANLKEISKTGQSILKPLLKMGGKGLLGAVKAGFAANGNNPAFWEWDWKSPETWTAVLEGFGNGLGQPVKGVDANKQIANSKKDEGKGLGGMLKKFRGSSKQFFKENLKDIKHPLWKTLGKSVVAYVMASLENDAEFNPAKWDWRAKSTYEGLLNGFKLGSEIKGIYNDYYKPKPNPTVTPAQQKTQNTQSANQKNALNSHSAATSTSIKSQLSYLSRSQSAPFVTEIIPIAIKMLASLSDSEFEKAQSYLWDDDDFWNRVEQLVSGIQTGTQIFPTGNSTIGKFVDCFESAINATGFNGFALKSCNIGTSQGKVSLQNQEISKKLFVASNRFQSKNEFLEVPPSFQPNEYTEEVINMFTRNINPQLVDESFEQSVFAGAIYNSLLNQNSSGSLFFGSQEILGLNVSIFHLSYLIAANSDSLLATRAILFMEQEDFDLLKPTLVDKLTELRPECLLPRNSNSNPSRIQAEYVVITKSQDRTKLYVLTPEKQHGSYPCDTSHKSLIEIPKPSVDIQNLFQRLQETDFSDYEKLRQYQTFLDGLNTVFEEMNALNGLANEGLLIPFVYGLLSANMKKTYGLKFNLNVSPQSQGLLFVAGKGSQGEETFTATPGILVSGSNATSAESNWLAKASILTLGKNALVGVQSNDQILVNKSPLPAYDGFFDSLFSRDVSKIEKLFQYIYHSHHIVRNSVERDFARDTANVENQHFASSFVLGEFLSRMNNAGVEIYAYIPYRTADQLRLKAQRIFFLRNLENNRCSLLNVIESSVYIDGNYEFDPSPPADIPSVPDIDIEFLQMFEVRLNINSKSGWNLADAVAGTSLAQTCLQSVTVRSIDTRRIPRDSSAYFMLPMNSTQQEQLAFSQNYIGQMFQNLQENRFNLLIQTDNDFQAVVTGLLQGASIQALPDADGIKLALRSFITDEDAIASSLLTMSLHSIAQSGQVLPQTEQVLLASLKAVRDASEAEGKLILAKESIMDHYCSREDKLKEVFKMTHLPGVFQSVDGLPPEYANRVLYEVNPSEFLSLNCSAREGFMEFVNRYSQQGNGTSNFHCISN